MAAIRSPAKINKLWKQINDRYGPEGQENGAKPKGKEAAAARQNEQITKGCRALKAVAQGGVKKPGQVKKFEATRAKVLRVLLVYCKTLKTAKADGYQDLSKFRKNVRQLAVTLGELSAVNADTTDGDVDLTALLGVDDSQLDQALEDPNLATGADDVTFDEADEAAAPDAPPAPPAPPPLPDALKWRDRRKALEPALLQALKEQRGDTSKMRTVFTFALEKADGKEYAKALQGLDQLDKLLKAAPAERPGAAAAANGAGAGAAAQQALTEWQQARTVAVAKLHGLARQLAPVKHPETKQALILINAIIKNLTPQPSQRQQVFELERFLTQDQAVADACEAQAYDFRPTLLRPLNRLKDLLPA